MSKSGKGRKRGSRNRGYFFRASHKLWCANAGGKFVPLLDEHGERLRDQHAPVAAVKAAYARFLLTVPKAAAGAGVPLWELTRAYLERFHFRCSGTRSARSNFGTRVP